MQNVSRRLHAEVKQEAKPKRGINNKTSTLRAEAIKAKIAATDMSSQGRPSRIGYGSFDSRSRSMLPPIKSVKHEDSQGSRFFEEDSKAFGDRKGTIDYASPQMKL